MSSVYDALIKAGKKNETISSLSLSLQGISLEWKIMILVLGLLFLVIVNHVCLFPSAYRYSMAMFCPSM